MIASPRGTKDFIGDECRLYRHIVNTCLQQCHLYGLEEIMTPIFEFAEVFKGVGATSDIISKETYTFQDRSGDNITLRPEGTAPTMRAIISNGLQDKLPGKYCYQGPMFRYDRPQKGRYRQFHQFGVEMIGVVNPVIDAECIMMALDILKKLGLGEKIKLKVNTLGDIESRLEYRKVLLEYLQQYNNDLSQYSQQRMQKNPLRVLDSKEQCDQEIVANAPRYRDHINKESQEFFTKVLGHLTDFNIDYNWDDGLVRGLDYYCHSVFEFVTEDLGAQGTVLAGGRYDGLVKSMGGGDIQGVGWALGIERLMLLCEETALDKNREGVIFVGLDGECMERCNQLAQNVRNNNIRAQVIYSGSLGKKMKKAGNSDAKFAVILGEDEMKEEKATLKNLETGTQTIIEQTQLIKHLV